MVGQTWPLGCSWVTPGVEKVRWKTTLKGPADTLQLSPNNRSKNNRGHILPPKGTVMISRICLSSVI